MHLFVGWGQSFVIGSSFKAVFTSFRQFFSSFWPVFWQFFSPIFWLCVSGPVPDHFKINLKVSRTKFRKIFKILLKTRFWRMYRIFGPSADLFDECFEFCVFTSLKKANVSNFCLLGWHFWRMFRILCLHAFGKRECFEFLASGMWFWANVSYFLPHMSPSEMKEERSAPLLHPSTFDAKSV